MPQQYVHACMQPSLRYVALALFVLFKRFHASGQRHGVIRSMQQACKDHTRDGGTAWNTEYATSDSVR
eukprot:1162126-Lingulodinium_polyedra.AAC.1